MFPGDLWIQHFMVQFGEIEKGGMYEVKEKMYQNIWKCIWRTTQDHMQVQYDSIAIIRSQ